MADHWDAYWTGTRENAAHRGGGPQEAALNRFWQELLIPQASGSLLDVACGNGAVTGQARSHAPQLRRFAVDYSVNACIQLTKRDTAAHCVAADALRLPFADACFDLVCSQFGMEYAGPGAFMESARLLAAGGTLAVVAHLHEGAIHRECAFNLQVAEAILHTQVLPRAREAFTAGFALNAGTGDVAGFKAAERSFTPTVRALEQVLKRFGSQAADGLTQQIYKDIAHMYRQMSAFEADAVLNWVDGMTQELHAYCGRMRSMCDAALNAAELQQISAQLRQQGIAERKADAMTMGSRSELSAWALIWQRA